MFGLKALFPDRSLRTAVERFQKVLDGSLGAIVGRQAETFRQLVLKDFTTKSQGGRGADGLAWTPDSPSTIERKGHKLIGIDTHELIDSLRIVPTTTDNGHAALTAEFTSGHAQFFDAKRQLLPDDAPPRWVEAVEAGVLSPTERVLQDVIDSTEIRE